MTAGALITKFFIPKFFIPEYTGFLIKITDIAAYVFLVGTSGSVARENI